MKKAVSQPVTFLEFVKDVSMKPFPYSVKVIVSTDVNQSMMNRPKQVGPHESNPKIVAMHCPDDRGKGNSWVFLPFEIDCWDIAHEAYHAVRAMFRYVGTEGEEEELVAYHLGHLIKATVKHIDTSNKKRKANEEVVTESNRRVEGDTRVMDSVVAPEADHGSITKEN